MWFLHFGVVGVAAQSGSSLHCTHFEPSVSQMGVGAAQSVFARQKTHAPRDTLHFGVAPEHCELSVQPAAPHLSSSGSQRGSAAGQSAFDVHCAQ